VYIPANTLYIEDDDDDNDDDKNNNNNNKMGVAYKYLLLH
jgi:hypothetical protein